MAHGVRPNSNQVLSSGGGWHWGKVSVMESVILQFDSKPVLVCIKFRFRGWAFDYNLVMGENVYR